MKIMVSACLLGENCKYNGSNNLNKHLLSFLEGNEVIPVCPEVLGGLSIPRKPAEIRNGTVINSNNESVDAQFRHGAEICLQKAFDEKPDLIVMQPRSPSCGVHEIYDGSFSGKKIPGSGITARLLMANGFCVAEPDEVNSKLHNFQK